MSNIKDVAKLAGVSVLTVYKVFSSNQYVGSTVEEKAMEVVRELGYVHKAAQKGNIEKTIAVIIDDITNPFYGVVVNEIREGLNQYGHHLITTSNMESWEQEGKDIQALIECKTDALIFVPALGESQQAMSRLIVQNYPLLQLFRLLYPDTDTILIDDELGAHPAVKYLLQSGHRRTILVTRSNPLLVKREEGYARAYQELGIPMDEQCICLTTYVDNIREMLKTRIREIEPTTILSMGEGLSVSTAQALREMSRKVLDDVSLIVYDDLAWTAAFGISTASHSFKVIGNLASGLIVERLKELDTGERKPPVRLVLDPKLVTRNPVKVLL